VSMRPEVDRAVCAGYGECEKVAPGYFRVGEDDVAEVIDPPGEPADPRAVELAVAGCPVQAIRLVGSC
jgi:ferredoxin